MIKTVGYINMRTLAFTTTKPRNKYPKPSKRQQGLIDRMRMLGPVGSVGIEKRGKYWEVFYYGHTACELHNLTEVTWQVESFERQHSKNHLLIRKV